MLGTCSRADGQMIRCCLPEDKARRAVLVPEWMFDSAICSTMTIVEEAHVSHDALSELSRLLKVAGVSSQPAGVDTSRVASDTAAHGSSKETPATPTAGACGSSSAEHGDLGSAAGGNQDASGGALRGAAGAARKERR